MKIRKGFISNSSSSSFIVRLHNFPNGEPLVSTEEQALLLKYGFYPVNVYYSSALLEKSMSDGVESTVSKEDLCNTYGYYVSCNQDEVIAFLLVNNIPFTASTNYGTNTVIYKRGSSKILFAENAGIIAEMYGEGDISYKQALKSMKVSKWLEKKVLNKLAYPEYK